MEFSIGLVYDLLFLCLLVFCALRGGHDGLIASLFGLVGNVFGIAGAVMVSQVLGTRLYADYLGKSIGIRVEEAVAQTGGDLTQLLRQMDFLPETVRDSLSSLMLVATDDLPAQIITLLEPLLLPLIQVVVFVLVCLVIRLVFHFVSLLLRGFNEVPLVGGLNRNLGFLMGLAGGVLDCWIVSLVLWLAASVFDNVYFLRPEILRQSQVYTLLAQWNPFLG